MSDVLITPASGKIEFFDGSNNIDAKIELDVSGNLNITNPGGDISIGDTTADVYIGDGVNSVDIRFEQAGTITGQAGVTLTLGESGSNIRLGTALNLNSNNLTNVNDISSSGILTVSTTAQNSAIIKAISNTGSFVQLVPDLNSGGWNPISSTGDIGLIFSTDGNGTTSDTNGFVIAPWGPTTAGIKIMENGNIGIGTTSPTVELHAYDSSGHSEIRIETSASADSQVPALSLKNPNVEWSIGIRADNHLHFRENSASYVSRLVIADGGNVGIGTSTPQANLHIQGAGTQANPGHLRVSGTNGTNGEARISLTQSPGSSDGDLDLLVAGADSRSDGLSANDSYITASQKLNLRSRGNGSTANTEITLGISGAANYSDITFKTATQNNTAVERMRITSDGKVGIGTNNPNTLLHVNGTLKTNFISWAGGDGDDVGLSKSGQFRYCLGNTGSNYINTWMKVATINLPNSAYSALQVVFEYIIPNSNFGASADPEIYHGVIRFLRDNDGTPNSDTDTALIRATTNNVRVYKTSTGVYELQAKHPAANQTFTLIGNFYSGASLNDQGIVLETDDTVGSTTGGTEYTNTGVAANTFQMHFPEISATRIGIGTTNPGYDLEILGSARIRDQLRIDTADGASSGQLIIGDEYIISEDNGQLNINSSDLVNRFGLGTNLNVGIGAVNSSYRLNISDNANTVNLLRLGNDSITYDQGWTYQLDTSKDLVITGASANGGVEYNVGSRGFRVLGGNLGVRQDVPQATLHVNSPNATGEGIRITREGFSEYLQMFPAYSSVPTILAFNADLHLGVTNTDGIRIDTNSNVGIGTTNPNYKLEVVGSFAATTKSFVIDHPTKEGMKLRHGSLEGPEDGVYVRGRLKDTNIIDLPDYWTGLVHEETITVNLTAIGSKQELWVEDIRDNCVIVGSDSPINCFYTIYGTRKDVDGWNVEFEDE